MNRSRVTTWTARLLTVLTALVLGYLLGASERPASAEKTFKNIPTAPGGGSGRSAVTYWVGSGKAGAKKNAGKNLTQLHGEFSSRGWTFQDLESYIENGDLQGYWVTYLAEQPVSP